MAEKLSRLWRYAPGDGMYVWRIMFLEPDLLVCEKRQPNGNATFFSCLSLPTGNEVLKDFSLDTCLPLDEERKWLSGLETTRGTLFYIHSYRSNSPEHMGIWAVDPYKGKIAWARPEAAFVANLSEGMLAYEAGSFAGFPERHYRLFDCRNGEVLDDIGEDSKKANMLRRRSLSDEKLQNVLLPVLADPDISGSGVIEYIEHGSVRIVVEHVPGTGGKGYDAYLTIARDGAPVYSDMLVQGSGTPYVNYFILRNVTLYYIRNLNELISVRL